MNPEETTKAPEQPPYFIALTGYSNGYMTIDNDDSAEAIAVRSLIQAVTIATSTQAAVDAAKELLQWIAYRENAKKLRESETIARKLMDKETNP